MTPPKEIDSDADSRRSPSLSRLTIFALLYAWANILHQLSYPEWIMGGHLIGWLLFISSAALALKPTSTSLFVCTLALRLAYTLDWMPMLREHLFLEGILTLGILLGLLIKARDLRQYKSFTAMQQEELFEGFAAFLRASSLIVYGAVTICKLNSEFLDPAKSESVNLLLWTAKDFAFVPTGTWAQQLAIWSTLLFEGGIPLLLLFRRTRWLGMLAGVAFHTLLGFLPLNIWSFSSTMFLLLAAWMPPDSGHAIRLRYLRMCHSFRIEPPTLALVFYLIAGTTGMAFAARHGLNLDMHALDLGTIVWWWQTLAIAGALWALRGLPGRSLADLLAVRSKTLKLYLLFVAFNCLCPYLGLKNRLDLSMHSNLRTAKGYWNHLFLPESMRVFGYQDDLITIIDSDSPDFGELARLRFPIPYFEFRRWCRLSEGDFYVAFIDSDGIERRFEKVGGQGSDPDLMEPHPLLEKFLCFDPIGANYDFMPELIPHIGPSRNRFLRIQPN